MSFSPAFGQADLTNCERELIHFAGSVQPHGVLLAVQEPGFQIIQASANAAALLGIEAAGLLTLPVARLGGDIDRCLRRLAAQGALADPEALRCRLDVGGRTREFEGTLHRIPGDVLLVELEPVDPDSGNGVETVDLPSQKLLELLGEAVQHVSTASTVGTLADAVVRACRNMMGYDRVMVYKFDPDGHGKIIAEARDPRLDSLLGHHYPSTDIPQRARELYLRTRLRVLVDVNYEAAPLVPRRLPGADEELDMSLCQLRSMSPLHLQYLKNMGVSATLVVSLVREGRLWGLIACHHYAPRNLRFAVRATADLLAEVASTRIAAIENYAYAQVAIQVRRLEQRLVEATSTEGDWRVALFRNPRTMLQPLDATGAALFYEGEVLTAGETPNRAELRELLQWIDATPFDGLFSCASVERANPALDALTPTASGVVAVKLSATRSDYLLWFRKEQLSTVTWAGDPTKPVVDNDPMKLSPRRSFAAWSEIVRGTAVPWSASELALARALGAALIDIIAQVNAVRLLIAEHQLAQIRATVSESNEPVVIADAEGRTLFANRCFLRLVGRAADDAATPPGDAAQLFTRPDLVSKILSSIAQERRPWRGELALDLGNEASLPVALRAELVPARDGSVLGYFLILTDLTDTQRAALARRHLETSLSQVVARRAGTGDPDVDDSSSAHDVFGAILSNASLAAMDITDGNMGSTVVPLLEEIEASARRAATLYSRVKAFSG